MSDFEVVDPPLWRHKMNVLNSKFQNMLEYWCLKLWANFVKIRWKLRDFSEIYHKISNFEVVDPPLWRHRIVLFSSKFQNMLKYMYLNFLPNLVKIRWKMTDFLLIYHKNVKFWGVWPPLWRHKMPVFG